jgi:hypothetical protein
MEGEMTRVPEETLKNLSQTYDYIKKLIDDLVKDSASCQLYYLDKQSQDESLLSCVLGSRCKTLSDLLKIENGMLSVVINKQAR